MLVGRSPELASLREAFSGMRPVTLLGEAGIGKTALLRAAAQEAGGTTFEGGGLSMLSWHSYLPIARAVGSEPPPGDHAAIATFTAERVGDGVLILDDLHWADPDTLAVLPHLAGRIRVATAVRRGDPAADRALAGLEEAGFEIVPIDALGAEASRELIRQRRPSLPEEQAAKVVGSAAGNPLLLEELTAEGDGSEALRISLATRLDGHSPAAREAVTRLALIGHAAEREVLGNGVDEMLEAGLVVEGDGGIDIRHPMLAESVVEGLGADERERLHSLLARALADPGEAAAHHLAAGEEEAARQRAMEAAESARTPGERAHHLGLAAQCATGPDADRLRLLASAQLTEAGGYGAACDLASSVESSEPAVLAERALCLGRAHAFLGDAARADEQIAAGLTLVEETGIDLEVRLRVELARLRLVGEWGSGEALDLAERAWTLAEATGVALAEARYVLACAQFMRGSRAAIDESRAALAEARASGDGSLECQAAMTLAITLVAWDDAEEARDLTDRMIGRARELRLRSREVEFRNMRAQFAAMHQGRYEEAIAEYEALLAEPALIGQFRYELEGVYAGALADLGRIGEARAALEHGLADADTAVPRQYLLWWLSEVEWLAGRASASLAAAEQALEQDTASPNQELIEVTRCWASLDAGKTPSPVVPTLPFPHARAIEPETRALALMAEPGGAREAEGLFAEAAERRLPLELRSSLRCRWAAGWAALEAGAADRARERLVAVEEEAATLGMAPLLARIRGSLRRAGVRRAAPRESPDGALSAREREVLALVGRGLTSSDIAARLGLARSTVDSQVKSAMSKLGVKSRRRAALLAAAADGAAGRD